MNKLLVRAQYEKENGDKCYKWNWMRSKEILPKSGVKGQGHYYIYYTLLCSNMVHIHVCIRYMKELGLKFCNEHDGVINKQMTNSCHLQHSIMSPFNFGRWVSVGEFGFTNVYCNGPSKIKHIQSKTFYL